MRKISMIVLKRAVTLTAVLTCLMATIFGQAKTGYAQVNGIKMYYEVHGAGKPIVLLHGAFNTINTAFAQLIPELSKTRQVIALELQGHGRTQDIDRPFSFESMADDVTALLKFLKIDSADIFGYSMGGGVAQQIAIRHPEVVRRLIITSSVYKYEGWSPETRAILPMLTAEMFERTPIKQEYDKLAPDPKHWKEFINKMKKFVTTTYDFGVDKIKAIRSPTLIIIGDGDGVLPEHAVDMYRLRGGSYMVDFGPIHAAQLAILPGSSHISVMMQTNWLVSMVVPFLDASLQQAKH
jgi:pimeloyl-ACP methyl ester carboxylesterase